MRYAVNTNGLRNNYSKAEIVEICKAAGADGIEWGLPTIDKVGTEIKEMDSLTRAAGLQVAGYINGGKMWQLDELRTWAEYVAGVGGKTLRVAHPWVAFNLDESIHQEKTWHEIFALVHDAIPELVALSEETGVRFVCETHSGALCSSALAAAKLFEGISPVHVGVIYDPANMLLEGNLRPRSDVEILGDHLAYVHAKNVILYCDGERHPGEVSRLVEKYNVTQLCDGMLDFIEVFFALHLAGYDGWVSVEEFFTNSDDPARDIREAFTYLKLCAQHAPTKTEKPFTSHNNS